MEVDWNACYVVDYDARAALFDKFDVVWAHLEELMGEYVVLHFNKILHSNATFAFDGLEYMYNHT